MKNFLNLKWSNFGSDGLIDDFSEDLQEKNNRVIRYKQLRMPINKITEEFQQFIEHKVTLNFPRANIIVASEKDVNNIARLYNRAWLTSNTPFQRIEPEIFERMIKNPRSHFLMAKVYGIAAGFIIADIEGENDELGFITGLAIEPRFQRKGLGTALALAAWNLVFKGTVKELRCEVYVENIRSLKFVKSMGFEEFDVKEFVIAEE